MIDAFMSRDIEFEKRKVSTIQFAQLQLHTVNGPIWCMHAVLIATSQEGCGCFWEDAKVFHQDTWIKEYLLWRKIQQTWFFFLWSVKGQGMIWQSVTFSQEGNVIYQRTYRGTYVASRWEGKILQGVCESNNDYRKWWNMLPGEVLEADMMATFKSHLDRYVCKQEFEEDRPCTGSYD